MSNANSLQPFTFDLLCYLNRDQLERFSIVCRPFKNLIERYFHSKPYRVYDELKICKGSSYALFHKYVQWHPNQNDYSLQQFLAGQTCIIDNPCHAIIYYSFVTMRPYLGTTIRIKWTHIYIDGDFTYNSENIEQMESIAYLWRNGKISVWNWRYFVSRVGAEDLQLILNSPIILQCRTLYFDNVNVSFKDYNVLKTVKAIETFYEVISRNSWLEFLEQPGVKPLVVLRGARREQITDILDCLCKSFSSAVLPNEFKLLFTSSDESSIDNPLTEFENTNKASGEKLELKQGFPAEYEGNLGRKMFYTVERSST